MGLPLFCNYSYGLHLTIPLEKLSSWRNCQSSINKESINMELSKHFFFHSQANLHKVFFFFFFWIKENLFKVDCQMPTTMIMKGISLSFNYKIHVNE